MLKRRSHLLFQSFGLTLVCLTTMLPVQAGDGVWTTSGPDGGYVYDVAADPSTAGTIYAATSTGLFKSVNAGASWSRAQGTTPNELPDLSILVVAVNPNGRVYLGTRPSGLFWSDDGGNSWFSGNTGIEDVTYIDQIAIDPDPPHSTIFIGARTPYTGDPQDFLFRSDDGGESWVPAHGTAPNELPRYGVQGLAFAAGTLYVASDREGVWKTTDSGTTWQPARGSLPTARHLASFRLERTTRSGTGSRRWLSMKTSSRMPAEPWVSSIVAPKEIGRAWYFPLIP